MTTKQAFEIDSLSLRVAALEARIHREQYTRRAPRELLRVPGSNTSEVKVFATEGRAIRVGERVLISKGVEIVDPVDIGDGCSFNCDPYIRANVTFGMNCKVGPPSGSLQIPTR